MLVETLLPIIPSEVILPLAGFEAAQGRMHPVSVIVAGTLGSLLGSLPWYWLGKRLGAERVQGWVQRHGRWMGVTPREVQRASEWLQRHGAFALTVGRCIPGVRGVISLPAGVVGVSLSTFIWACTAGSALWSTLLVGSGYVLKANYGLVGRWLSPVGLSVLAVCAMIYVFRVSRRSGDC